MLLPRVMDGSYVIWELCDMGAIVVLLSRVRDVSYVRLTLTLTLTLTPTLTPTLTLTLTPIGLRDVSYVRYIWFARTYMAHVRLMGVS